MRGRPEPFHLFGCDEETFETVPFEARPIIHPIRDRFGCERDMANFGRLVSDEGGGDLASKRKLRHSRRRTA
jgi:hypothetical protein